jgi:single-strand DNA-binding protein
MLNVSTIMGRLTRDPELRRTDSGIAVTSFSVAVDRDRAPEGQEKETDFIDCVAWRGTAEFVSKYFSKGSMIVVSGRLQIRSWTDKEGQKRRSAEIVADNVYFGEGKKDKAQEQPQYGGYQGAQAPQYGGYNTPVYQTPQQAAPPQYAQGGFGGYQQPAFQAPAYQPPQGQFARIDGPDPQLPF